MARPLHLFKGDHADTAVAVIAPQLAAGDEVTVAVLGGATPPALSPEVTIRRVPDDLSYDGLVALIFEADAVVTW